MSALSGNTWNTEGCGSPAGSMGSCQRGKLGYTVSLPRVVLRTATARWSAGRSRLQGPKSTTLGSTCSGWLGSWPRKKASQGGSSGRIPSLAAPLTALQRLAGRDSAPSSSSALPPLATRSRYSSRCAVLRGGGRRRSLNEVPSRSSGSGSPLRTRQVTRFQWWQGAPGEKATVTLTVNSGGTSPRTASPKEKTPSGSVTNS
mmetsp:Transcript_12294/g.31490  ORF Transcript_12294/g.31490 Transcript_12294/m.31490 type:complete len:202 (-) Transcript_12294:68-673(-)